MSGTKVYSAIVNTSTCCGNGAPPNKFGVLHNLLNIEFHSFNGRIDASGLSHFGSWYYLNFFRESMGPFKVEKKMSFNNIPVRSYVYVFCLNCFNRKIQILVFFLNLRVYIDQSKFKDEKKCQI